MPLALHASVTCCKDKDQAKAGPSASTGSKSTLAGYFKQSDAYIDKLLFWLVHTYQPISTISNEDFRTFAKALNPKVQLPNERKICDLLVLKKHNIEQAVKTMLLKQDVAFTMDSWTSNSNTTYFSWTAHFIDENWKLQSLALDIAKHEGSTTQDHLVSVAEGLADKHGLTPTSVVTDCEPSMVAAGRNFEWEHTGCFAHRLEIVSGVAFKHKGQ